MRKDKKRQAKIAFHPNKLRDDYDNVAALAERFRNALAQQLQQIVDQASLKLAVPIESRVKTWDSIAEKLERRSVVLKRIVHLPDLIGVRLIFLFNRDLQTAAQTIRDTFKVVAQEDTAARLGDTQFGYQSWHYIVKIPDGWTNVPTFKGCEELWAEIQLRTIAQHTWAQASHLLQYKHESSVPLQVRRSINRVSALLETVDLEFERVLSERESYLTKVTAEPMDAELLNVDILGAVLNEELPPANRTGEENYADLEKELKHAGVGTTQQLRDLIKTHIVRALEWDAEILAGKHHEYATPSADRVEKGVYLSHAGLVRQMLRFAGKR
jgi:putative GTP pyrophosphokinase